MKKKRAFTLVETLMSSGIFGMIALIGLSVISLMTWTLFSGQIESTNRSSLDETVYYITREIQSAEKIKITDGGKTLQIKERGSSGYNLKYSITEGYPSGYLAFGDRRMIDIAADESCFTYENGILEVELKTVKNNIETNQRRKPFSVSVRPRCECVWED